ncbi:MAG: SsrA-binding protein SmpB [bacterium]|nr:SsrA-binding protein SmpB [bacterium]
MKKNSKFFAQNRKVGFDFELLDKYEAGIILTGHETKAVKDGRATLNGAFVDVKNGKAELLNAVIKPYQPNNAPENYKEDRVRELLLNRKELKKLQVEQESKGLTIVPISLYNKNDLIKLEIALARRRKKADKREAIKKRDFEKRKKQITR